MSKQLEERASQVHSKWKQLKAVGQSNDDYLRGVVNGLAMACGILHGHEPKLVSKPGSSPLEVDPALSVPASVSPPPAQDSQASSAPVAAKTKKPKTPKKPKDSSGASEPPPAA